jgi:hypothetical protein
MERRGFHMLDKIIKKSEEVEDKITTQRDSRHFESK